MADAEENKLPINSGDIRSEMETLFGPNIIGNLDKIGMTFDEAWNIVKGDFTIQRMLFVRVNSRAMHHVTPLEVRNLYQEYAQSNIRPDKWIYQVVTIRDKDPTAGAQMANSVYQLLTEEGIPLADIPTKAKELTALSKTSQVNISDEYKHDDKEVSPVYKGILQDTPPGTYSKPSAQKSRTDKSTVFRLFYLKEMIPGGAPPFNEVENTLKQKLLEKNMIAESKKYLNKLRKHFDIQEMVPEEFQPFSLK